MIGARCRKRLFKGNGLGPGNDGVLRSHARAHSGGMLQKAAGLRPDNADYCLAKRLCADGGTGWQRGGFDCGIGGRGPGETNARSTAAGSGNACTDSPRLEQVRAERRVRRGPGSGMGSDYFHRRLYQCRQIHPPPHPHSGRSAGRESLICHLRPTSRRLRFQGARGHYYRYCGLFRDLPKDLLEAFQRLWRSWEDADLLLHVIDLSNLGLKRDGGGG